MPPLPPLSTFPLALYSPSPLSLSSDNKQCKGHSRCPRVLYAPLLGILGLFRKNTNPLSHPFPSAPHVMTYNRFLSVSHTLAASTIILHLTGCRSLDVFSPLTANRTIHTALPHSPFFHTHLVSFSRFNHNSYSHTLPSFLPPPFPSSSSSSPSPSSTINPSLLFLFSILWTNHPLPLPLPSLFSLSLLFCCAAH